MKYRLGPIIGIAITFVTCLTACVKMRSVSYDATTMPAKRHDSPIALLDSTNSNRPYRVIGIVEANAGRKHSPADTIEHLKDQARALGGDGILDVNNRAINAVRELWSAKVIVWAEE